LTLPCQPLAQLFGNHNGASWRTSQHAKRRKMIRLWRAITGAADGILAELNKLIETLRADLQYRR
jgi:hypothetical protein